MTRAALLIGTSEYADPALRQLRAPAQDVDGLGAVLGDPDVGGYRVTAHVDATAGQLTGALREFFADRVPDDVLVLYFSGHGIKDVAGELFLTASDTRLDDLDGTAVSATVLSGWMRACRSRRILLILDCCYSGAFGRGMFAKAGETVHVQENFRGRGLAIITATTAVEYAFEGRSLAEGEPGGSTTSTFTAAVIRGLDTGEADDNLDQRITLDELYYYVFDTVRAANPGQTPCWWLLGGQGSFLVAARRPGTTARRPHTAAKTPARTLVPDRRMLATTIPVGVAGGALIWVGLTAFQGGMLWSVAVLGVLLVLAALARTATVLAGRTHLEGHGIRVSPFRPHTVPWPSILAVEARLGLFGRSLVVHRGDRPHLPRLALPAPSRAWTDIRGERWRSALEVIREHSVLRGSPTVVVHRRWSGLPTRAIPALALAVLLLASVDRPWTWEGIVATKPPDACLVLNEDAANTLAGIDTWASLGLKLVGGPNATRSQFAGSCQWSITQLRPIGYIRLGYDLSQRTFGSSARTAARAQLANFQLADTQHGAVRSDGLDQPGYLLQYETDASAHSTVRLLCGNVVTSLELDQQTGQDTGGEAPDPAVLTSVAEAAVANLTRQVPGLC